MTSESRSPEHSPAVPQGCASLIRDADVRSCRMACPGPVVDAGAALFQKWGNSVPPMRASLL